ncbi:peroxiredoxin 1 [Malassezia cuniculi]|uniref:Peroxiredoxin 1 n=1 Tax=Malassezia cuniculi TaxID=948313 RepID=A0AAF0ERE1_9BASI|nr:peroxiredoxin 1 [Malassezia cuniculi]
MTLRLGSIAPDFSAKTTHGPIQFHEWLGESWAVLFSHPDDFTPVCTTELGQVATLEPEFRARGVKVIVARLYDMLDALDATNRDALGMPMTVRDVFFIDPRHIIRARISYPASTGRDFGEILRVVDSLLLVDKYPVTTPANWRPD